MNVVFMRADRLLKLMLLLENRGKMTAAALAEELEVSTRTILRDIDALSFSGVPIYAEGGHGGGISLDENYRVKLNGLKEAEVQAWVLTITVCCSVPQILRKIIYRWYFQSACIIVKTCYWKQFSFLFKFIP